MSERCEKCGGTDLAVHYFAAGQTLDRHQKTSDARWNDLPEGVSEKLYRLEVEKPLLRKRCRTCQWWWTEEPGATPEPTVDYGDVWDEITLIRGLLDRADTGLNHIVMMVAEDTEPTAEQPPYAGKIFELLEHYTPERRAETFYHIETRWCWDCGRPQLDEGAHRNCPKPTTEPEDDASND